jgi:hypothetical protein
MLEQLAIEGQFQRSVYIRVDKEPHRVADVGHALAVLTTHLKQDTERRVAAVEACRKALRGELHPPIARRLFVSAALEARVLIGD